MDFRMHVVNELLICSICLERFKEPKILPCHHSFCQNCIQRIGINEGKICCPTCRSIHDASNGFQNDFRTNQLLDSHNAKFVPKTSLQPSAPLLEDTFNQNFVLMTKFLKLNWKIFQFKVSAPSSGNWCKEKEEHAKYNQCCHIINWNNFAGVTHHFDNK